MTTVKQDRSMARTATDVERRYKLGTIEDTANELAELKSEYTVDTTLSTTSTNPVQNSVITANLNQKVNKESGKSLTSNDFTDDYKTKLDTSYSNYHTHSNKTVLDGISSSDITNWNNKSDLTPYTLYENSSGSASNITLLTSASNYDFIDIVYGNSSIYKTQRVYSPNGKSIELGVRAISTTDLTVRAENDSISGTTITRGNRHKLIIDSTGTISVVVSASIADTDKILIYKVIGYKS